MKLSCYVRNLISYGITSFVGFSGDAFGYMAVSGMPLHPSECNGLVPLLGRRVSHERALRLEVAYIVLLRGRGGPYCNERKTPQQHRELNMLADAINGNMTLVDMVDTVDHVAQQLPRFGPLKQV